MSLAAVDLQNGCKKVIDISPKYGYDSPTAFNRAFKSVHGIAPSQSREEGTLLKAFPPISIKITIKGDSEMNYRIEKKEAFRTIGISEPLAKEIEKTLKEYLGCGIKLQLMEQFKTCSSYDGEPIGL